MSRHHLLSTISHTGAALVVGLTLTACGEGAPAADPTQVLLARTRGLTALRQDRLEDAEARFQDLLRMVPDEVPGYGYLALVELRRGRLDEARRWIREGLERAEDDPELRLMLASALRASGSDEEARAELEASLARNPEHLPTIFALAELDAGAGPGPELEARAARLARLLELAPANAAVRLDAAETLLRLGRSDSATAHLETLRQQLPDAPEQARAAFDSAVALGRSGTPVQALDQLERFRGYFEVTGPYQAARREIAPPPGQLVGIPSFTFSFQFTLQVREEDAVLEALRYADGSAIAELDQVADLGPDPVMAMGDFDGDGDEDLFAAGTDGSGAPAWVLLRVDLGLFVPLPTPPGSMHTGRPRAAVAGDYDNDGFLDLFVTGDAGSTLLRNLGDGSFEDVSSSSGVVGVSGRAAVFADLDHDGDLDLYVARDGTNAFLRNNGDGSFTDLAAVSGLSGHAGDLGRSVAFADLDDDGDLDLVVANEGGRPSFFTNERGGRFREVGDSVGLGSARGSSVAVADYDGDGALDVFLTGDDAPAMLYRNRGDGTFEPRTPWPASALQSVRPRVATFLDFDNDGRQDLLVSGPARSGDGPESVLLHNEGGTFRDVTDKLPASAGPASALAVVDYNEDGDLDVFMATPNGLLLLRNDGGNLGHFLQIELEGLAAGSGKNNRKGIGSRIEVRSGDLYQVVVVTDPTVHLGLGSHRKADVVRIEWTNGVAQDVYFPGTDQDLEKQILKGSCPMLFTWDGEAYVFQKDVMWKSALGMPTGIMGNRGARSYAPSAASREYVKILGKALKPKDGRYSLQITEELWETFYLDEVKLLAVDHPDSVDVFVDERFVPPGPWVAPRLYLVSRRHTPLSAVDDKGRDVLAELREHDDRYVATLVPGRYQGLTEMHDLILDLGPEAAADSVLLFLRGWVFPADASINVAMAQSGRLALQAPVLQVPDRAGRWVTVIDDLGFPAGKDKTVVADLSGKFLSGDRRVRIRTNMQIYWDHAFFSTGGSGGAVAMVTLDAVEADLHYRGFSRTYRKGGRYGPHWFDYGVVTTDAKWRDLIGSYTRYGDVTPLLDASDDMYVIMNAGDETTVEFDARAAPELPAGWSRDFLLYTVGWVKDGDLNTATGKFVEPLPFHGMSEYPYGPEESYPRDEAHLRYLREYNTRGVTPSGRF